MSPIPRLTVYIDQCGALIGTVEYAVALGLWLFQLAVWLLGFLMLPLMFVVWLFVICLVVYVGLIAAKYGLLLVLNFLGAL